MISDTKFKDVGALIFAAKAKNQKKIKGVVLELIPLCIRRLLV